MNVPITTRLLRIGANIGGANRRVRVQETGGHRAETVEHDLRHEPPQEERGEIAHACCLGLGHADV